ncbi:hypothetical protein V2J09_015985, partial [Rumex salicifolius]
APPSIFRLPSLSFVVLLLLPAGASSSSFLLRDLALSLTAALFLPLVGNTAILEADDDEELLERVKKDR